MSNRLRGKVACINAGEYYADMPVPRSRIEDDRRPRSFSNASSISNQLRISIETIASSKKLEVEEKASIVAPRAEHPVPTSSKTKIKQ